MTPRKNWEWQTPTFFACTRLRPGTAVRISLIRAIFLASSNFVNFTLKVIFWGTSDSAWPPASKTITHHNTEFVTTKNFKKTTGIPTRNRPYRLSLLNLSSPKWRQRQYLGNWKERSSRGSSHLFQHNVPKLGKVSNRSVYWGNCCDKRARAHKKASFKMWLDECFQMSSQQFLPVM